MKCAINKIQIACVFILWQPVWTLAQTPSADIDWPAFLAQHDMTWDRIPDRWEVSPFTGNGNVGFLFYRGEREAKDVISIYAGRHDYYDHRLPHDGKEMLWIYRSRLPLGHFKLTSRGDIQSVDLRLSLWNAELTGTITTSKGSYRVHGLTHSEQDVLFFETDAQSGESLEVTWHPDQPIAPVKQTLDAGGGPKGASWDAMRMAPYPLPPEPIFSQEHEMQFCLQPLLDGRGETTTGWKVTGDAGGKQRLVASIHHSFPQHNSLQTVRANLLAADAALERHSFLSTHRQWWHDYYPLELPYASVIRRKKRSIGFRCTSSHRQRGRAVRSWI